MKSLIHYVAIFTALFLLASNTYAATLQVYPVDINFCGSENAQAIYVKNTGSAAIGAQVRVYHWDQKNNKDTLEETQALLISPPMATIPPSREQLIRVIIPAPASGENEQAYRLIVDELPGRSNLAEKDGVRFLLRYSLPVFVNCHHTQPDSTALTFSVDPSVHPAVLQVHNGGNQHVKLENIVLTSGNRKIVMSKGLLGYVLPHREMAWPLPENSKNISAVSFNLNDNEKKQTLHITS